MFCFWDTDQLLKYSTYTPSIIQNRGNEQCTADHVDGSAQDNSKSSALEMVLLQSYVKSAI